MDFVNFSLLAGGAFVAVPIVLHLVMRQQPKYVEFPALRFLRERREANRRRLQVKHWLLLLLRCAAIALLALALARPSLDSALVGNWVILVVLALLIGLAATIAVMAIWQPATRRLGMSIGSLALGLIIVWLVLLGGSLGDDSGMTIGDRETPIAAALVFDTSPRMEYRQDNRTRLEQAQEMADWLIRQLPDESEVAVFTSRARASVFAIDLGAAKASVDALQTTSVPKPLPEVVADAVTLLGTSQKTRREVYVFTDVTASAWDARAAAHLRSKLDAVEDQILYLIDVGVKDPQNFALGDLRLGAETLSQNAELTLQTEILHQGPGGPRAVELHLEGQDDQRPVVVDGEVLLPEAKRRSLQSVNLEADGAQLVQFTLKGFEPGTTHGRVQIVGQDNLAIDDIRHFTIAVNDAWPVLIVRGVGADSRWLVEALAPYEFRQGNRARFRPEVIREEELPEKELANYDAVCLLDPGHVPKGVAKKLVEYADSGGSVAVFLGRNAKATVFNGDEIQQLLPAPLEAVWPKRRTPGAPMFLAPRNYQHSILAAFRPVSSSVPWQSFPVYWFWNLGDVDADAIVVAHFDNGRPAILEQVVGEGRVVTMTTPISDAANVRGRPAWNRLATGMNAWPFLLLSRGILADLVKSGDERLNYLAGQRATLKRRSATEPDTYLLFSPLGGRPQELSADDDQITVKTTTAVGAYRLKAKGGGFPVRGFCVNLPKSASQLERAAPEQLDEAIGPDRYRLFRSREEIEPGIRQQRRGREFFPALMVAVAIMLAMEHALSNRFYPQRAASAPGAIAGFREEKENEAA